LAAAGGPLAAAVEAEYDRATALEAAGGPTADDWATEWEAAGRRVI
jgi:hypothetical protein